uniref:FP protein C-terminal domain-containing protein n=1 Tax=Clastoptera arizonana TaxID=38151 RepID=A0A1B6CHT3_9HEMI
MSDNCYLALKPFNYFSAIIKVECKSCKITFDEHCVNLSKDDIDFHTKGYEWECSTCIQKERKNPAQAESLLKYPSSEKDMSYIWELIKDEDEVVKDDYNTPLYKEVKTETHLVVNVIKSLSANFQELVNVNSQFKDELVTCVEGSNNFKHDIFKLRQELGILKNEMYLVNKQIEGYDQHSRRKTVDIFGVPFRSNEDVLGLFKKIGMLINFHILDDMIDDCYRHKCPSYGSQFPPICVEFVRNLDKKEFLQILKQYPPLFSSHIGFNSDYPLYVNESLTQARRKIYNEAKQFKLEFNYRYLWVHAGKIYLRKDTDTEIVQIACEKELNRLRKEK